MSSSEVQAHAAMKRANGDQVFQVGAFRFRKKAKQSTESGEGQGTESSVTVARKTVPVIASAISNAECETQAMVCEAGSSQLVSINENGIVQGSGEKTIETRTDQAQPSLEANLTSFQADHRAEGQPQVNLNAAKFVQNGTEKASARLVVEQEETASITPEPPQIVQGETDARNAFDTLHRVLLLFRMCKTTSLELMVSDRSAFSKNASLRQICKRAMASQFNTLMTSSELPHRLDDEASMQAHLLSCAKDVVDHVTMNLDREAHFLEVLDEPEPLTNDGCLPNPINEARQRQLSLLEQVKENYEKELAFWEEVDECRHHAASLANNSLADEVRAYIESANSHGDQQAAADENQDDACKRVPVQKSKYETQHALERLELACDVLGTTFKRLQQELRNHHATHNAAADFLVSQVFVPCDNKKIEHPKNLILGLR